MPTTALARPAPARPALVSQERREAPRHADAALTIELEGRVYRTVNWSLGGFLLGPLHRVVVPGERLAGVARDPTGNVAGEITVEAVWTDTGRTGFQFVALPLRLRLGLAAFR